MGHCYDMYLHYDKKSSEEAFNKSRYNGEIDRLRVVRQNQINDINRLNAELRKEETALQQLEKTIRNNETDLSKSNNNISAETATSSTNFTNMVVCSSIAAKSLNNVFGTEFSSISKSADGFLTNLEDSKRHLNAKINDKKEHIRKTNENLVRTENEITKNANLMNAADKLKRDYASMSDDYYRRYKNGEDDPV